MPQTNRRQFLKYTSGITGTASAIALTDRAYAQSRSPVVWSVPVGGELRKYSIGAENILTGNSDGRIRALDIRTGENKWEKKVDSGIYYGGLAQTERYIIAITEDNKIHFISKLDDNDRLVLPLSGKLSGLNTKDRSICIGTGEFVTLFDLPPDGETLDSWKNNGLVRWKRESGNFGPPVVWTDEGILVSGSKEDNNVVNILSTDSGVPIDDPSNNNGALGSYRRGYDVHSVAHS